MLVAEEGKPPTIRIYDAETGAHRSFANGFFPLWSPDDQSITFNDYGRGMVRKRLDTGAEELLVPYNDFVVPHAWIDRGRTLLYSHSGAGSSIDLYPLEPDGKPQHLHGQNFSMPSLTADERWIAYCIWPCGVFVGRFPGFDSVATVSESGCGPVWGPGDTRLYYYDFDRVLAVDVTMGRGVKFGAPEVVAESGYPGRQIYDVDARGRVVFIRDSDTDPKPPVLMTNWTSMLEP